MATANIDLESGKNITMKTGPIDGSLSINEVIISSLKNPKFKDVIVEFLDQDELLYHTLVAHYDPNVNYSFPGRIIDDIMSWFENFNIREHGEHIDSSAEMGGADPAAYPPDGSWTADLYEFMEHYMWVEPEGEKYGFFSNLESAERFGEQNYGS
jgi:hypothetical protein